MVGEVVTGAVSGVMTSVASAAPAVMEAPVAAAQAILAVAEAPLMAADVAQSAVKTIPEAVSVPLETAGMVSAIPSVANTATEAADMVQEGLGGRASVSERLFPDTTSVIGELHAYIQQNDATGALEFLAFGKFQQVELGEEGEIGIEGAFHALQHMLPENAQHILQNVQELNIPESMSNDPEFLKQFMDALSDNSLHQEKNGNVKRDASALKKVINESAKKAIKGTAARNLTEKDLDELKKQAAKKAAMLAIREYMNQWRRSVAKDKRLDEKAQTLALKRINLLEARLLTQEAIKWDGVSVMKIVALATVMVKEMQEDSLPQPKL